MKHWKNKVKEGVFFIFAFFLVTYSAINLFRPDFAIRYFGFSFFIVQSDSMQPKIKKGDFILVTRLHEKEIQVDDILAMKRKSGILVVHSVAEVFEDEDKEIMIKTKPYYAQDKRDWDYEAISMEQVYGKYAFRLPKFGHVLLFLRSKYGLISLSILSILIYLLIQVRKM